MRSPKRTLLIALLTALALLAGPAAGSALAEPLTDDGGAEWRLEQPAPPAGEAGVEGAGVPIGLGPVGDVEFYSPDRGALITAGNGSTIKAGVWGYNGREWHAVSSVCGATHGRIVWSGPDEFWTISDGRSGQAASSTGTPAPLEDNSICRFGIGSSGAFEVLASYAKLAFEANSYTAMSGAACLSPSDCWFGGEPLPPPQVGTFELHWNGAAMTEEPYLPEGHSVGEEAAFDGQIFQSVMLRESDQRLTHSQSVPAAFRISSGEPFSQLLELPLYGISPENVSEEEEERNKGEEVKTQEFPYALGALHMSSDSTALWAAAGLSVEAPEQSAPAAATIVRAHTRYDSETGEYAVEEEPEWEQILGPTSNPMSGGEAFPKQDVSDIAAEPATESAWVALGSLSELRQKNALAHASLARVTANGTVSDRVEFPLPGEETGPKGAAERIVCPAAHDCWMATTQGWLYHLATASERENPTVDSQSPFTGGLITSRPIDESVPQEASTNLQEEDSGINEKPEFDVTVKPKEEKIAKVFLPVLSGERSRLIKGTTLDLSFDLSVKARVKLIARRHGKVVASTPSRVLKRGRHSLLLRLNAHRWPTNLQLQTHALEKLRTHTSLESGTETISTSLLTPRGRSLLEPAWDEAGRLQ